MMNFHRENRRCNRLGTTLSKSIRNALRYNMDAEESGSRDTTEQLNASLAAISPLQVWVKASYMITR